MVEANEIRLGNYLLDRFGEIEELKYVDTYQWIEGDYSGIPINEEWLVKFGMEMPINDEDFYEDGEAKYDDCFNNFKKTHQDGLSATFDYKGLIFWAESTGFWCNVLNNYTHIKYVHQFQNLIFALSGEELTVSS